MKQYEVGIAYLFWADDADHAVEQFLDAIDAPAWIAPNYIEETGEVLDDDEML